MEAKVTVVANGVVVETEDGFWFYDGKSYKKLEPWKSVQLPAKK